MNIFTKFYLPVFCTVLLISISNLQRTMNDDHFLLCKIKMRSSFFFSSFWAKRGLWVFIWAEHLFFFEKYESRNLWKKMQYTESILHNNSTDTEENQIIISIQKTKSNLAWTENHKQTKGTEHPACYFINPNWKNKK